MTSILPPDSNNSVRSSNIDNNLVTVDLPFRKLNCIVPYFCFVFCMTVNRMNSDDFYGPALPPGFRKTTSDTPSVSPGPRRDCKRHHSSSSDASQKSSRDSDRPNGHSCKLSEKDDSKLSERLFGPALPAGFSPGGKTTPPPTESSFIGPVLPSTAATASIAPVGDDEEDDFGPSPSPDTEMKTRSTIEQIKSRAQLMKDKLEGKVFCCCSVKICFIVILVYSVFFYFITCVYILHCFFAHFLLQAALCIYSV